MQEEEKAKALKNQNFLTNFFVKAPLSSEVPDVPMNKMPAVIPPKNKITLGRFMEPDP